MANRVIRDWTASETVDLLSAKAEVFFTRLIMKADDYGNYTGNPKLINAALFPLKIYEVLDVMNWIEECEKAGLLRQYKSDGKTYLHIQNFGQTLRRMKAVYPPPTGDGTLPTSDGQMTATFGQVTAETKRNEVETETETEGVTNAAICDKDFKYEFKPEAAKVIPDTLAEAEVWTESVIDGNDHLFMTMIKKQSLKLAGLEQLARDHLELSAKYAWHSRWSTQQEFRYSLVNYVKEQEKKQSNERTKGIHGQGRTDPERNKDYKAEGF
jgi:hypothetical protein